VTEDLSLAVPGPRISQPIDLASAGSIDLTALVAAHSSLLYRVAHSILRNPVESEDVVQDTFLRVLQHLHQLPAIRDLRPWLVRIAWNLALDRRRRIRPDQMDDFQAAGIAAVNVPADIVLRQRQQTQATLREIERLPKPERQALLLSALEDLSIAEIAHIMTKSESAVRALIFRARARLRQRLAQGGHV
jgi:RNA polymerase sigma-70 factor (ECF subfamily)